MKKMLINLIAPTAAKLFIERPAQKKSFVDLREKLESTAGEIKSRIETIDAAAPSEKVVDKLRHIIAIERWGQERMLLFFADNYAESAVTDENYGYEPAKDLCWQGLGESFGEARAKTIEIARVLETGTGIKQDKIPQNDMGPLSAKAWLQYLNIHAAMEAKGIK